MLNNFKLNGVPFNPCFAGWIQNDSLSSTGYFTNDTIDGITCSGSSGTVTLHTSGTTGMGVTITNGRTAIYGPSVCWPFFRVKEGPRPYAAGVQWPDACYRGAHERPVTRR